MTSTTALKIKQIQIKMYEEKIACVALCTVRFCTKVQSCIIGYHFLMIFQVDTTSSKIELCQYNRKCLKASERRPEVHMKSV